MGICEVPSWSTAMRLFWQKEHSTIEWEDLKELDSVNPKDETAKNLTKI